MSIAALQPFNKKPKKGDQFIELEPENLIFPFRSTDPEQIINPFVVRYISGVMESISCGQDVSPAILNVSVSWPISVTYLRKYDPENTVDRRLALCESLVAQFAAPEQTVVFVVVTKDPDYENKKMLLVSYILPGKNFLNLKFPFVIESDGIKWLEEEYTWDKDVNETNVLILRQYEAPRYSVVQYASILKQSLQHGSRVHFYQNGLAKAFSDIKETAMLQATTMGKIDVIDPQYEKNFFLSLVEDDIDVYMNFLTNRTESVEDIKSFISEAILDTSKF